MPQSYPYNHDRLYLFKQFAGIQNLLSILWPKYILYGDQDLFLKFCIFSLYRGFVHGVLLFVFHPTFLAVHPL